MSSDKKEITDPVLHRWLDGELTDHDGEISRYIEDDPRAQAEVEAVRTTGEFLRSSVSEGLSEVEP